MMMWAVTAATAAQEVHPTLVVVMVVVWWSPVEAVMEVVKTKVGVEKWEAMSEEERDRKYKTYRGDCWQHLRNIS